MFPPKSARQLTRQKSGQSRQKCTHNSGDSLCCCTACNAASCSLKSLMAAISELSARHRLNADKRIRHRGRMHLSNFLLLFYQIRDAQGGDLSSGAGKSVLIQLITRAYNLIGNFLNSSLLHYSTFK